LNNKIQIIILNQQHDKNQEQENLIFEKSNQAFDDDLKKSQEEIEKLKQSSTMSFIHTNVHYKHNSNDKNNQSQLNISQIEKNKAQVQIEEFQLTPEKKQRKQEELHKYKQDLKNQIEENHIEKLKAKFQQLLNCSIHLAKSLDELILKANVLSCENQKLISQLAEFQQIDQDIPEPFQPFSKDMKILIQTNSEQIHQELSQKVEILQSSQEPKLKKEEKEKVKEKLDSENKICPENNEQFEKENSKMETTIQKPNNQLNKSQSKIDIFTKLSNKYNELLPVLSNKFINEPINSSILKQKFKEQESSIHYYKSKYKEGRDKRKELIQKNEQLKFTIENFQKTKDEENTTIENEKLFKFCEQGKEIQSMEKRLKNKRNYLINNKPTYQL
jgi:hypothetical protein